MPPSRETLLRLQDETGFSAAQLEVVLRLLELLVSVAADPLLGPRLVLKGGTPLNLAFGPPPRLSVDLDFNYVGHADLPGTEAERPKVVEGLERLARRAGYTHQVSRPEHAGQKWFLRDRSTLGGSVGIQVDINFLHRVPLAPTVSRRLWSPIAAEPVEVRILQPAEIVAGKMVALLDRAAPRDLYDVARIADATAHFGADDRAKRLFVVLAGSLPRSLSDYSVERVDRITDEAVRASLYPLLRQAERPSVAAMRGSARGLLAGWLNLSAPEREFCDRLQSGELLPELVFPDDPMTAALVRTSPALQWKVQNALAHRRRGR